MASLGPLPEQSHTMVRSSYQRDDWRRLQLNDAVEDSLSKILRFGFDIDRAEAKPATAQALRDQILAWAKHISGDIPSYTNWQEIYDFTFEVLYTPDAVPGSDATPIGTEANLVAELNDVELERAYALQDEETEKNHLTDHALSLRKARHRQDILDRIPARYSAANPMPLSLAQLFRKIRYTYKLRECLLGQVGSYNGSLELAADMTDHFEYRMYLVQMKLTPETVEADYRRKLQRLSEAELDQLFNNIAAYPRTASLADKLDAAVVNQAVGATRDWQTRAVANYRPIYTGTSGHMLSYSRIFLSNVAPEGCRKADHPTLEQLRVTLLAALIGFNQLHTYDECMVASHELTYGGAMLKYTDRVGYRDIIDSTDSFVRNKVGKPLLQAMIEISKQFVANFEELEAALSPPLPNPRPLVA